MTATTNSAAKAEIQVWAEASRQASRRLATTSSTQRNAALHHLADLLQGQTASLLAANAEDVRAASASLEAATLQRLRLDPAKVVAMVEGVRAVAALPDPLQQVQLRRELDEGLELTRVSCPLGVLCVIFEARPDALIQISALALKSGNAVLLKGGSEAQRSHAVLTALIQEALRQADLPEAAVQSLPDREAIHALLQRPDLVDLVIPRGSKALVQAIQSATRIPVLGHADGVCHMVLDEAADTAMALALVRDAKLQYPAACNAVETVLIHQGAAVRLLPPLVANLRQHGAELRGCASCRTLVPDLLPATEADWDAEYGAPILALKIVADLDEALAHIRAHGSGHTEAIVTEDASAATRFLADVDAAGVFHNASTRFADGYRYGFGAEVGISTGRIHARGPVGLEGLLSHRYLLRGNGHQVADYTGQGARLFRHKDKEIGQA
ncbi:glutamate-5-semialdehyde dehydrogenase [Geothrix sp. PMB-07]|uniref:glutamate-5-semialdehyde dehydrogenase n=1 Tax=Geothrix sp. PMB-07 TaxID=3068640 RepID=UPI002741775A|nr:glutamate-5-semialdehyde dehydrogenase [Geothrix sp. PMB-07]WLT30540.1 glutamate-5-semialdehyde dehydrogenase [Geothrix sp. PMB-07]